MDSQKDNYELHALELAHMGYRVVPIKCGEKRPIGNDWNKYIRGVNEVKKEIESGIYGAGSGTGVGILTGVLGEQCVIAIDVDVENEEISDGIMQWCKDVIGESPIRWGKRPKGLMLYRYDSDIGRKKEIIKVWKPEGMAGKVGAIGKVEIMGTGQQVIMYHVHPQTGEEYKWEYPCRMMEYLPEITEEGIDRLRRWVTEKWPAPSGYTNPHGGGGNERGNERGRGIGIGQLIQNILLGLDYHDSIVQLSQQYKYSGMKDADIISSIKGLMNSSAGKEQDTARWQSRYDDIERIVYGANEHYSYHHNDRGDGEDDDDFHSAGLGEGDAGGWAGDGGDGGEGGRGDRHADGAKFEDIPWPPGELGKFIEEIYEMQIYQHKEIAIVTGIGLLAGICGRKFNVSGTGLNLYLTLLMDSGGGKDAIRRSIAQIFGHITSKFNIPCSSSFLGDGNFTSKKAIYNSMVNARSRVSVHTEAGLMRKQAGGDPSGVIAYLLSLYTASGMGEWSPSQQYSKKDDYVPSINGLALTIISESTPDAMLSSLRDADAELTGELARQNIYRIDRQKPYMNENVRNAAEALGDYSVEKLMHLHKMCSDVQCAAVYEVHNMDFTSVLGRRAYDFAKECVDMENSCGNGEDVKRAMYTRAMVKALKLAALAEIFNSEKSLIISLESWEWAKALVLWEIQGIDNFMKGSAYNNELHILLASVIQHAIVKLFNDGYKEVKLKPREKLSGIISLGKLRKVTKSAPALRRLDDDPRKASRPRTGFDKVIDYAIHAGYIRGASQPVVPSYLENRGRGRGIVEYVEISKALKLGKF